MPQTDQALNQQITEEFRANNGQIINGYLKGAPILLLHTKGAKSGREYVNPLADLADGERLLVFTETKIAFPV
jgi:hypothetical protein